MSAWLFLVLLPVFAALAGFTSGFFRAAGPRSRSGRWWADPLTGVLARAGVTYRNMHTTRHTFATRLIKRGARLATVKKLMGHSSIQTTVDIYGHLDVEDDVAAISLLEVGV